MGNETEGSRTALEVARRCLCLELLFQRLVLETDDSDTGPDDATARDRARSLWLSRTSDLGIDEELFPAERALLERPVGSLTEDDLDDLDGRASGSVVLLWALGRIETRPGFAAVSEVESLLAEVGLLGDGSIARARAAAEAAELRPESELDAAISGYRKTRGKAKETSDPEKIVAELGAHHLAWILDRRIGFEDDIVD
jgi:hypothetical protein